MDFDSINAVAQFYEGSLDAYGNLDIHSSIFLSSLELHGSILAGFLDNFYKDPVLVEHKNYVVKNSYGYGDQEFHWMWKLIVDDMPNSFKFLEIGVYKGQVLSLIGLLAKRSGKNCQNFGVTPLAPIGDAYSKYDSVDYLEAILSIQEVFGIDSKRKAKIIKGLSNENSVKEKCRIIAPFDVVYIDGGHDYKTVVNDIITYSELVNVGGYLVIDDASYNLDLPRGRFRGWPDVTRAAKDFLDSDSNFRHMFAVGHNRVWRRIS
jgi:hypothetical protein